MKIAQSNVALQAYSQQTSVQKLSISRTTVRIPTALPPMTISNFKGSEVSISREAKKLAAELKEAQEKAAKENAKQAMEQGKQQLEDMNKKLGDVRAKGVDKSYGVPDFEVDDIKLLLLELMLGQKFGKSKVLKDAQLQKSNNGIRVLSHEVMGNGRQPIERQMSNMMSISSVRFTEETYTSESVSFGAQGSVTTADGRSISFDVSMNMSREQYTRIDGQTTSLVVSTPLPNLCDPLMLNLDGMGVQFGEGKYDFDLTADGKMEQISFTTSGSGFLAIDKNGDGKVNDGSELFGTQSGDGFKDLAHYDSDRNGWIDENDEVWDKLLIWVKDDKGNDLLYTLKDADVGAIYLGNVNTQWSFEQEGQVAQMQKSGVYLKESGGAGTIHHIDLVI